jgi:Zn finger protein HypA/HybF involved in hydrogenase expression
MDTKHAKAVLDLFNCNADEVESVWLEIQSREGVTLEGVMAAFEVVFSGNDVEGAAIGVAAVDLAYPDHGTEEHEQARRRVLDSCCPMLQLQNQPEFSEALDERAYEMMEVIFDAAGRIAVGQTLGI